MKNVLNVTVSCFENCSPRQPPVDINLMTWLKSAKYKNKVDRLRNLATKSEKWEVKKTLPAITVSGTFKEKHKDANLINHTGLICIDIDLDEEKEVNTHIENFADLKDELCNLDEVAYCGLSVSGKGFFLIVPLAYPEKHKMQFEQLKIDFLMNYGIEIDKKCGNLARLRIYSFDDKPYFNPTAIPYDGIYTPPAPPVRNYDNSDDGAFNYCLDQFRCGKYFSDYGQWRNAAFAIQNKFGESGRDYFHVVSSSHPHYKPSETDKMYDKAIRYNYGIPFEHFYNLCKDIFIYTSDYYQAKKCQSKPIIKKKEKRESFMMGDEWDKIGKQDLEEVNLYDTKVIRQWLKNFELPTNPIQVNPHTKINDIQKFFENNLALVEANKNSKIAEPYFNRLIELKNLLDNPAAFS